MNIRDRDWAGLTAEGIDALIQGNLASAFYCMTAVLPIMRAEGGGLLILTASMAGRFIGGAERRPSIRPPSTASSR